jgi:hypothetical protein
MKAEYNEGPEALERFEAGMKKLFHAPKVAYPSKPKTVVRKRKKASKG